jgi:hypothetical protein
MDKGGTHSSNINTCYNFLMCQFAFCGIADGDCCLFDSLYNDSGGRDLNGAGKKVWFQEMVFYCKIHTRSCWEAMSRKVASNRPYCAIYYRQTIFRSLLLLDFYAMN